MKFLLIISLLLSCVLACNEAPNDSKLTIINGSELRLTPQFDNGELPFMLGYKLSFRSSSFGSAVCSGVRYGYQTIITPAHCVFEHLGRKPDREDVYIKMVSGAGFAFGVTQVKVHIHENYYDGCLRDGLRCPDIALLHLPDDFVKSEAFIKYTDPVVIDEQSGFPQGRTVDLAGFGCLKDNFYSLGYCDDLDSFDRLAISIATDIEERDPFIPFQMDDYYFRVGGSLNDDSQEYGVALGDSGGPLFEYNQGNGSELQRGDRLDHRVHGMAIFYEMPFEAETDDLYVNAILDFGEPSIFYWLKENTSTDGQNLRESSIEIPDESSRVCDPGILSPKPTDKSLDFTITREFLGFSPDKQEIIDQLNQIRDGHSRLVMASCFAYIHEQRDTAEAGFRELSAVKHGAIVANYEFVEFKLLFLLESLLEWQDATDRMDQARLEQIHLAREEAKLALERSALVLDVIISATPVVSTIYDVYMVGTGRDFQGQEISNTERGITAAVLILPGFLKAGGKLAAKSTRIMEKTAVIVAKMQRYRSSVGRFTQQAVKTAHKMKLSPQFVKSVFTRASSRGFKTVSEIKSYLKLGKLVDESCEVLDQLVYHRNQPAFDDFIRHLHQFLFPTAYAADWKDCLDLADELIDAANDLGERIGKKANLVNFASIKRLPVEENTIILDNNIASAWTSFKNGKTSSQRGENAWVDRLLSEGHTDLRITDVSAADELKDISHLQQGIEISVSRNSPEYTELVEILTKANVGKEKGIADRHIVADVFFAKGTSIPTLMTGDKKVSSNLFRLSGGDPAKLGRPVSEVFPQGFEVSIKGRTIKVIPMGRN